MRQFSTLALLFSSVLTLSACSHLSEIVPQHAPVVSAKVVTKTLGVDLASLEQRAAALETFEYVHNNEQYIAYLSTQPELIKVQKDGKISQFFYQAGKINVIQDESGIYQFDNMAKMTAAVNVNGQKVEPSIEKQQALLAQSKKLHKILGYNKADGSAGRINTGNDAKVNYLCIAKIQQVAQTHRVFRSPDNAVVTANSIHAMVRLNGNQYYTMDCQLSGDKVSKLSLIKK
ncbi:hypothetical protein I926_01520 [Pasteurella multocida subsp. multocida OH4807]|nr:hypothetical protein I926_01520 [Pasteurella multocida subsp. multocida OH4807]